MRQTTKDLREWAGQYAHFLADFETVIKANGPTAFTRRNQPLNDTPRHRPRLLRAHYQRGDSKRSVDAPPPMFREIDDNEDVAGKKGLQSVPQPARVSNGPPQSRNETAEAQPMKIELRPVLLVKEHSCDEPTLPRP
jgi:hypothetical protein